MSSSKIESLVKELRLELMKEVRLELMKEGVNLCGLGVVEKRGRGRPRKEKSCGLGVVEKRGRGRPRKEKVSSVSGGEELIASLIRNGEEKKSEYGKRLLEDDVLEEELEDEKMLEKRLERDEKVLEKELEDEKKVLEKRLERDEKVLEKELERDEKKELEEDDVLEKELLEDEKKVLEKELEEDDVLEEEELEVTKFIVNGKTYLKSEEDILYDIESHDAVGIWNEEEKEIKEIPDDDE
jgi:hypothetical protein